MQRIENALEADGQRFRAAIRSSSTVVHFRLSEGRPISRGRQRRGALLVSAASLLAILCVAVGAVITSSGSTKDAPGGLPAASDSSSQDAGAPDAGPVTLLAPRTPVPAVTIDASTAAASVSMPWALTTEPGPSTTLNIFFLSGDGYCTSNVGFYVRETPESVYIEAASNDLQNGRACPANELTGVAAISLNAPLGSRQLLHAQVSPDWVNFPLLRGKIVLSSGTHS